MKILSGHTSPDTAYIVEDYPYGYTIRCKIRYWVEAKSRFGMRLCSQTTNPKVPGEVWNAPKRGTYSKLLALYLDDKGHVQGDGCNYEYDSPSTIIAYLDKYGHTFTCKDSQALARYARLIAYARSRLTELTQGKNIYEFSQAERAEMLSTSRKLGMNDLKAWETENLKAA